MPRFEDRDYAAFLFDMDGTLLDSSAVVERVWRAWADRNGIDPAPLLAACHGVQGPDLVRRFGPDDVDVAVEAQWLTAAELTNLDGIVPIAGASRFLTALDPADWAIVTSAPRQLAVKRLAAARLRLPAVLVAAEDVSRGKPDPEGFQEAARQLNVSIAECLIFEDSPAGVDAGRAAGGRIAIVGGLVVPRSGELAITDFR